MDLETRYIRLCSGQDLRDRRYLKAVIKVEWAPAIEKRHKVNIVGRIKGDLSGLWDVPDGAEVCIEKA